MGEGSGKSFREEGILENLKNVLNFACVTLIEQNCLSIEVTVKGTQLLKH